MSANEKVSCSVSQSFCFMFRIGKLYGVAPITYEKTSNGYRISISNMAIFVNYVVITASNVMLILALLSDMNLDPEKSSRYHGGIRSLVWITELLGTMAITGIAVYGGPKRTREDIKNIVSLHKINGKLQKFKIKNHHEEASEIVRLIKWGFFIVMYLMGGVTDAFVFYFNCYKKDKDLITAWLYMPYVFYYIITYFLVLQFAFTMFEICSSLVKFNDILEEISSEILGYNCITLVSNFSSIQEKTVHKPIKIKVKPVDSPKSTSNPQQDLHQSIRHLTSLYDSICDVIRRTNDNYAFGQLMLLLTNLHHLVLTPYNLIVNIAGENINLSLLAVQINWIILQVLSIIILIEPSYRTQLEVDRTSLLVGKLTIKNTDQQLSEELDKFSRYLIFSKASYSPLGIYSLSRCLLASIASSVCTYLVIIFQFKVPDKGEY